MVAYQGETFAVLLRLCSLSPRPGWPGGPLAWLPGWPGWPGGPAGPAGPAGPVVRWPGWAGWPACLAGPVAGPVGPAARSADSHGLVVFLRFGDMGGKRQNHTLKAQSSYCRQNLKVQQEQGHDIIRSVGGFKRPRNVKHRKGIEDKTDLFSTSKLVALTLTPLCLQKEACVPQVLGNNAKGAPHLNILECFGGEKGGPNNTFWATKCLAYGDTPNMPSIILPLPHHRIMDIPVQRKPGNPNKQGEENWAITGSRVWP